MTETGSKPYAQTPPTAIEIDRLVALDQAAWRDFYEAYFRKLRSFAYARTGDLTLAEDIASEVFAAALKGIGSYKQTGAPISAWLYRIARNITADNVERQRKRPRVSIEDVEVEAPNVAGSVEDRSDLVQAMRALTREQQEVISLRFFSDCSIEETASALGKSAGAVKLLQQRALGALRRQMLPQGGKQ